MAGLSNKMEFFSGAEAVCHSMIKIVKRMKEETPEFADAPDAQEFANHLQEANRILVLHDPLMLPPKKASQGHLMNLSKKLIALASLIESPENEALIEAENHEECLNVVADALAHAAEVLKIAAEQVELIVPTESTITEESLEEMAAIAEAFSESEDPMLMKQADVLDEVLMLFGERKVPVKSAKELEDDRIEQLKKKYHDGREKQLEMDGLKAAQKEVEKSQTYKQYRSLEQPLSTRTCPGDHFGASLHRVGENIYQCSLGHEVYDFSAGYTSPKGNKIPGGDVSNQTKFDRDNSWSVFNEIDTRAQRSGYNQSQ